MNYEFLRCKYRKIWDMFAFTENTNTKDVSRCIYGGKQR